MTEFLALNISFLKICGNYATYFTIYNLNLKGDAEIANKISSYLHK